jgi:hypothetical protein
MLLPTLSIFMDRRASFLSRFSTANAFQFKSNLQSESAGNATATFSFGFQSNPDWVILIAEFVAPVPLNVPK